MSTKDRELLAAVWEAVWSQRNQAWLQKPTLSPFQLLVQSMTNLRCFRRAQANNIIHWRGELSLRESWEAPPPGVFKVNTNGAIFEDDYAYGVGIVIHDWSGRFIAGKSMKFEGLIEASRAETMAAKEGMTLAVELGIRALVLECDDQFVIDNFGSSLSDLSYNGLILGELLG